MILTNQEAVQVFEGLNNLRTAGLQTLPIEVGYPIVKDLKLLEPICAAVDSMRESIGIKYGKQRNDGSYQIAEENLVVAQQELQTLSSIENTIELDFIPLAALKGLSFPLDIIYQIYPIIKENGEV